MPCMKRITCTFHSTREKSKISRCDTVERLILNFKHLQKINEHKRQCNSLVNPSCRMKRHNSFNDHHHQLKHKRPSRLLNPIDILNQAQQQDFDDDDENDEFINTLILKISLLAKDPMERLLEFQYKTELKNLATIEYYNQNEFSL